MERTSGRNKILENGWVRLSAAVLTGSLALTGCGRGGGEADSAATGTSATSPSSTPSRSGELPRLVFDDLHGGSPLIQVYPGVTDAAVDKRSNGAFNDGDSVAAECKTEGREVHSNPSLGEEDRSSDDWVRIQGSPGQVQYATAVYVENPSELLGQLPNC